MELVGGAERFVKSGGNIGAPQGLVPRSPRGRRAPASVQGFAQEPGRSHHLRMQKRRKDRRQQPVQARGRQVCDPPRERIEGHRYGTASEGNEATREGGWEVRALQLY